MKLSEHEQAERLVENLNAARQACLVATGRAATLFATDGTMGLIDEEDIGWVQTVSWHVHRSANRKNAYLCHAYGSRRHVMLHSHLLPSWSKDVVPRIDVEHMDGDSLNNRRRNLRYVTHAATVRAGVHRLSTLRPQVINESSTANRTRKW